jgi:hypothetical protein
MAKPEGVPIHVETAAFSVRDGELKTLIAGENNRAPMPWSLGVPTGVIEMESGTGAIPQPHEVALRGVRSVIEGRPDLPVTVDQVGLATLTAEKIACVAFAALVPPINTDSGHEHVATSGVWVSPDALLRAALPAKESHHYTLAEALRGFWQDAMNGWRNEDLTPLTDLLAPKFTINELRSAALAVLDPSTREVRVDFDTRNFARKVRGLLQDTGELRYLEAGRPARLYTYQRPADSQWRRKPWPYI